MKFIASAFAIFGFAILFNLMTPTMFAFIGKFAFVAISGIALTLSFSKGK
mgnify:CR=1 FL=1